MFDVLVGFRDPNSVPIRDFYEYSHNINYFALFINHKNVTVREAFLRFVGDILTSLPDHCDIEARMVPYLLSGFFDSHKSIQESAMEIMEQVGVNCEREKEKDFREQKQMGYQSEWTYDGKLVDLPLPAPFTKRPRLGCRHTVMCQVSKLIHPIKRELKDSIHEESRLKSANLLEKMIIYVEESIVEHLNMVVPVMLRIYQSSETDKLTVELKAKISSCLRLIGRFCPFASFNEILEKSLNSEVSQNEGTLLASLIGYKNLIHGFLEALPEGDGFLDKK